MMLPNGWKKVKIKDIESVNIQNGYSPLCVDYETKRKTLSLGALTGFSLDMSQQKNVSEKAVMPIHSLLKRNDILVSRSNTKDKVGRAAVVLDNLKEIYYPDLMMRFQVNEKIADCQFVALCLQSPSGRSYFESHAAGTSTSMVKINKGVLENFPIMLPPIEEQKKIVATLSVWDSAIEKMEKLIEALEERYQSYVNEFFFENQNDKRKLKMGDVFAVRNDRSVATEDMPLYSLTIENGITAKTDRYDRGALVKDKDSKKYKIVCDGDIVYNPANLRWGAIGQSKVGHNVVVSPIYEVLYARDNCNNSRYLSHYIMSKKMIAFYSSKTEGTLIERKEVKIDQFLRIDLYIEKDPVRQKKIADVLDMHQEEISNLKQQLENYKKQKQGLMQKLLTGQWRVK